MTIIQKLTMNDEASACLLAELAEIWPHDQFDEYNIAVEAPYRPVLLAALEPFEPRVRRCGDLVLTVDSTARVEQWLAENGGRQYGDWRLVRDWSGWCRVAAVGSAAAS